MFKTLRFSFRKSHILTKVRKAAEPKKMNFKSIFDDTMKDLVRGKTMSEKELYTEELLTLLSKDQATLNLLEVHNLKFNDLREMISDLELNGAGQIINGHYVAVSSIAFIDTLNILCNYWGKDGFEIDGELKRDSGLIVANQMIKSF